MLRVSRRRFFLFVLGAVLAACGDERGTCLAGDQERCQCGDGSWGYRTCAVSPDGGVGYGLCDCVLGLRPTAGSALGTPYMSGTGSGGGTRDAGTR